MNLDDINTVEKLEEYIKWSIQTPGSLFDGWIMTDDEIRNTADSIFNLANAGGIYESEKALQTYV